MTHCNESGRCGSLVRELYRHNHFHCDACGSTTFLSEALANEPVYVCSCMLKEDLFHLRGRREDHMMGVRDLDISKFEQSLVKAGRRSGKTWLTAQHDINRMAQELVRKQNSGVGKAVVGHYAAK